ncbi:MAG: type II secretion system protein GspM [Rhodoferax sp.]|nr:type II secretion system protein GspM [Rhodoferax sp.]
MNFTSLNSWWAVRAPREQTLLLASASLIGLALLWWLGVAPAWRTLQRAQQLGPVLQAQLATMQSLQAEARSLKAQPPHSRAVALQALESVSKRNLGNRANVAAQGPHAVVTLQGVNPEALAQWLAQVRSDARLTPEQAQWSRNAQGWQGSVQFALPTH